MSLGSDFALICFRISHDQQNLIKSWCRCQFHVMKVLAPKKNPYTAVHLDVQNQILVQKSHNSDEIYSIEIGLRTILLHVESHHGRIDFCCAWIW